jgi:hypothetical protein
VEFGEFDVDDTRSMHSNLRRPTLAASGISDIVNRRRQQSIRPDDRSVDSMDTLGSDHHPDELELASDGSIKGGTLPALVERLTVHDTLGIRPKGKLKEKTLIRVSFFLQIQISLLPSYLLIDPFVQLKKL